jgi:hypothetical protein
MASVHVSALEAPVDRVPAHVVALSPIVVQINHSLDNLGVLKPVVLPSYAKGWAPGGTSSSFMNPGWSNEDGDDRPVFGNTGGLAGLNQALNHEGLPGVSINRGDQTSDAGDNNENSATKIDGFGPNKDQSWVIPGGKDYTGKIIDVEPDGQKGSAFETGGAIQIEKHAVLVYGYGDGQSKPSFSIFPRGWWDPNPANDGTTSGPGLAPVDGSGHPSISVPGSKVDAENQLAKTIPGAKKADLATLARMNQRMGGGASSTPGVATQGHINPNPGDNDGPSRTEDASYLKVARTSADLVFDPVPDKLVIGAERHG